MKKHPVLALGILLSWHGTGQATTWAETSVPDPIDSSKKCDVHSPLSYGSYIYGWPSKYDQVFWPFTDQAGIWYCKDTGFVAFIDDFGDITPDERKAIAEFLARKGKPADFKGRLERLEEIYALRHKDPRFRNRLLRILARWHQELGDRDRANAYRKTALADILKSLEGELPEDQRLMYLYLAASYSRLFGGIAASDRYFSLLQTATGSVKDKKFAGYAKYLSELADETLKHWKPGSADYP